MDTNLFLLLIAVLAGAFSVLTPCVLVMLPAILAVTGGAGRRRVLGVLVGVEASFVGISLLAAVALDALGLPPRTQEFLAVAIIGLLGVTLLVPALHDRFQLVTSRLVGRVPGAASGSGGDGFRGGLAGGLGLGLVWAPCAGPILAAITAGANTDGFTVRSVVMALGFGLGMLGPLLLVLRGGHAMAARLRRTVGTRRLDVAMGVAMVGTAALIAVGGFTEINRRIAEGIDLTSTPIAGLERDALDKVAEDDLARVRASASGESSPDGRPSDAELELTGYPESHGRELVDLGPAPELAGIGRTYNLETGEELDAEYLRDKVVIYDFWTYSCINCIRTLPYLRTWHDRYADEGLVIVGVHAPEFAFERDERNVEAAIDDLDVTWPVATDPEFETWRNFHNRYWPAKYIVDREGTIRYVHYGEGGYDETEAVIRELLDKAPAERGMPEAVPVDYVNNTPETYLGHERLSAEQWRGELTSGGARLAAGPAEYRLSGGAAEPLERDQFTLTGRWDVQGERSVAAGDDSEIVIHYRARAVYLVLDPGEDGPVTVRVIDEAEEGGGTRTVRVDTDRLYTLRDGADTADATMRIQVPAGASAYAFTFG